MTFAQTHREYVASNFIKSLLSETGAISAGIIPVDKVDASSVAQYDRWITDGKHGGLHYMERYNDVRANPRLLLEGAKSIIIGAFPYYHRDKPDEQKHYRIARYARGRDYHEVVRDRLNIVANKLTERYGGTFRICIDTAPLRERYWAQKAGIGFVGKNNCLIVPGYGSYVFIGTIISTLDFDKYDTPLESKFCSNCKKCVDACPGGALSLNGEAVDARKCLSALTLEHRGKFRYPISTSGRIAGCDICQEVCPYNFTVLDIGLPEFAHLSPLCFMSDEEIENLSEQEIKKLTKKSALSRIKSEDFVRNIKAAKRKC